MPLARGIRAPPSRPLGRHLHEEHEHEADREHDHDAEDAPVGCAEHGDERVHSAARGSSPHDRSWHRGRRSRPRGPPGSPEPAVTATPPEPVRRRCRAPGRRSRRRACRNRAGRTRQSRTTRPTRAVTMTARARTVIEATRDDRADSRDQVRSDAEHRPREAEAERHGRNHRAEREDSGEAVAVHRAGEQEPERRTRPAEQPDDVLAQQDVAAKKFTRSRAGPALFRHVPSTGWRTPRSRWRSRAPPDGTAGHLLRQPEPIDDIATTTITSATMPPM